MKGVLLTVVLLLLHVGAAPAADTPTCFGQPATIVGTDGGDFIVGTDGPDVIATLGDYDVIFGQGGDDLICGGGQADQVFGGLGDDKLNGQSGRDALYTGETGPAHVDLADGVATGNDGTDLLVSLEVVIGLEYDDRLYGNDNRNLLRGGDGDDYLAGRGGADHLLGESGRYDTGDGGGGADECRSGQYVNCERG